MGIADFSNVFLRLVSLRFTDYAPFSALLLGFSFASLRTNYRLCPVLNPSSGLPLRWFYKVLRNCSVLRSSSSPFPLLGLSTYHRLSSVLKLSSKHQQSPAGLLFCLGINTGIKKADEKWCHFLRRYAHMRLHA